MRIKLFFIDFKSNMLDISLRSEVAASFQPFSSGVVSYGDYLSFSDMAEPFSVALKGNDIIAVFSSLDVYPESKDLLIRALGLKTTHRFDVYFRAKKALEPYELQSPESSVHTQLPLGAALFVPQNGLYSGFCVHSRNQYIMFFPFEGSVTREQLPRLADFLNDINGGIKKEEELPEYKYADISEIIANAGVQIAIARTPAADFICAPGAKIENFHRYFLLCAKTLPKESESPNDYIVKQAIFAAKTLKRPYGIAISNIFTSNSGENKELKIYCAVAGMKKAGGVCITAKKGESIDGFFARSVNALFDLLLNRLCDENPILKNAIKR